MEIQNYEDKVRVAKEWCELAKEALKLEKIDLIIRRKSLLGRWPVLDCELFEYEEELNCWKADTVLVAAFGGISLSFSHFSLGKIVRQWELDTAENVVTGVYFRGVRAFMPKINSRNIQMAFWEIEEHKRFLQSCYDNSPFEKIEAPIKKLYWADYYGL